MRSLLGMFVVLFGFVGGCGGAPAPAAAPADVAERARPPSAAELSPALAPLAWWLGDWRTQEGGSEHWVAAGGALFGVAFDGKGGFEVLIVDDAEGPGAADGKLRLFASPGGAPAVRFDATAVDQRHAVFANLQHDFPKQIEYRVEGAGLLAEISGDGRAIPFRLGPGRYERGEALEAADLAFAADTAARGIEGWMAAFEPGGWQILGGKRASGEAIRNGMGPFLQDTSIRWAPVASQLAGELGFTIGKATFTTKASGESWRGVYVTIWHRQPDGAWKVRFDTGRTVNEPQG